MDRETVIRLAREAGIPETETEGIFRANSDDLGRLIAAVEANCVCRLVGRLCRLSRRETWYKHNNDSRQTYPEFWK